MATRRSARIALNDLAGQPDPITPLDWQSFLAAAGPVLTRLQDDLRERAKTSSAVAEALLARHADDKAAKRTGDSFVDWQDHFIEQVAAAWVLSCVFVRTLEDRGLLGHGRLAGPGAADSLKLFLELAPSLNERDYLLTIFRELTRFPATRELFDARHNPVWLLTPSADGAKALVQLFQSPRADVPAFRFGQVDTGFLGWIYQDLNAAVRERFALLQTPRFVESFILDRTLGPAITKFGLDDTTIIDPTCGSGHFLLGAFERLFDHHLRNAPGLSPREAAHLALNAVYGADINPYAVGIARFRLTMAFFEKAGFTSLATAPAVPLHVVVGDSLLHNPHVNQPDFADVVSTSARWRGQEYALEDEDAAKSVLHRKFAAVVGNPPYIQMKDAAKKEVYKKLYESAHREYSLGVPFTERFFQLGRAGGRIGMITANSFMKREFGSKLIENYLPTVNLDVVVNTSGAYIPGHGTPTVLLFGSAEAPKGSRLTTVLATRGEPTTPDDAEQGLVWRSIADHWSDVGFENEFISVTEMERSSLTKHPWSLGGGGAAELKELLEDRATKRLKDAVDEIGFGAMTRADDVYFAPAAALERFGVKPQHITQLVVGESVRDWSIAEAEAAVFPYDENLRPTSDERVLRRLWPFRTLLWLRREPNGNHREIGLTWWEWSRFQRDRFTKKHRIAFAFVATHNHFALDSGGRVFNRTAPIITLPDTASDDDHLALLAYLNSSTACFWMKQVCSPKGMNNGSESNSTSYLQRFEFDGTKLLMLPLAEAFGKHRDRLVHLGRELTMLAERRQHVSFAGVAAVAPTPMETRFNAAVRERETLWRRAIAIQDEIDWIVYAMFGLYDGPLLDVGSIEGIQLGARPFEVMLGKKATSTEGKSWFDWHGSTPVSSFSALTNEQQRIAYQHRHDVLGDPANPLRLLESSEAKRRWVQPSGKAAQSLETDQKVLRDSADLWVADRAEALVLRTTVWTTGLLRAAVDADGAFTEVLNWIGTPSSTWVVGFCEEQAVPFLAAYRYADGGLDRFAEWERTWDLQRREDAGETINNIPVPPKYGQGDYRSTTIWQLRGPLDVPKERFISYPGCESDQDGEPVYGWAGWDHEQRARALATLYVNRRDEESWSKERLTPMLAGLLELVPWLKQWHGAASDDYGGISPGAYYEGFLDDECRKLGLTRDDLRAWRPAARTRATSTVNRSQDGVVAKKPKVAKAPKPEKSAWRLSDEVQLSTYAAAALEAAALNGPMASWRAIEAAIFAIDGAATMSLLAPDAAKTWKHNLGPELKLSRDEASVRQACEAALAQLKRGGVVVEDASGVLKAVRPMSVDDGLLKALGSRVTFVVEQVLPLFESKGELIELRNQRPAAEAPHAQRKAVR